MADDDFGIDDPDGYAVASAAGMLRTLRTGATLLKAAAALATALWLLAVITVFWLWWDTSSNGQGTFTTGSFDNNRLLQVLASTLQSTWGYAIVAVLAFTGSMLLEGHRLRLTATAREL